MSTLLTADTDGTLPSFDDGTVQEHSDGCVKCCTPTCTTTVICDNGLDGSLCTGQKFIVPIVEVDGEISYPAPGAPSSQLTATATFTTPDEIPSDLSAWGYIGGSSTPYEAIGVYRKITINGNVYEFDGMAGLGISVSASNTLATSSVVRRVEKIDASHQFGLYDFNAGSVYGPAESEHAASYSIAVLTSSGGGGGETASMGVASRLGSWTQGGQYDNNATLDPPGDSNYDGDNFPRLCAGNTLEREWGAWGPQTNYTAAEQPAGGYTLSYADPSTIDPAVAGARAAPRHLFISGKLWLNCDPITGAPGYNSDDPPRDPETDEVIPAILREVKVSGRVSMAAVEQCGNYSFGWTSSGPVAVLRDDLPPIEGSSTPSLELKRVGVNLYRLRLSGLDGNGIDDDPYEWFVIMASGADPTTATQIEDFETPHQLSGGIYSPQDPEHDDFTHNVISIIATSCRAGDPEYFCDDECKACGICDDGPTELDAVAVVAGVPLIIGGYREAEDPCLYLLDNDPSYIGSFLQFQPASLDDDDNPHPDRFYTEIYEDGVLVFSGYRNCTGTGANQMRGAYVKTGGTATSLEID